MESLGRFWTNLASQFDDPIMGLINSIGHVRTNFRVRFTDAFACLRRYFSRDQHVPAPQFASLSFVVSSLLNFLQLMYTQGNADTPFQTHPIIISTAASSLLIYGQASDIEQRFSSVHYNARVYAEIARRVMMVFGSLLVASLASIFFPHAIQPLLYLVYIFVYAGHELQNWLHRRIIGEVGENENARLPL